MTQPPLQLKVNWVAPFEKSLGIPSISSVLNQFQSILVRNFYLICVNNDLFVFRINRKTLNEEFLLDAVFVKKLQFHFLAYDDTEFSCL
jgi:hypothetical protein